MKRKMQSYSQRKLAMFPVQKSTFLQIAVQIILLLKMYIRYWKTVTTAVLFLLMQSITPCLYLTQHSFKYPKYFEWSYQRSLFR